MGCYFKRPIVYSFFASGRRPEGSPCSLQALLLGGLYAEGPVTGSKTCQEDKLYPFHPSTHQVIMGGWDEAAACVLCKRYLRTYPSPWPGSSQKQPNALAIAVG